MTDMVVKGIIFAFRRLSHDLIGKVGVSIHSKQTPLGTVNVLLKEINENSTAGKYLLPLKLYYLCQYVLTVTNH